MFGKYFDEGVKRVQLEAAARVGGSSTEHEFVVAEQTEALLERLDDIREGRFAAVLDRTRGRGGEVVRRALLAARADVKKVTTHTQQDSEADLAVSILSQHWIDDLDQELQIVYNSLKPDAPFVGCMLSTGTLAELRSCLALAGEMLQKNVSCFFFFLFFFVSFSSSRHGTIGRSSCSHVSSCGS